MANQIQRACNSIAGFKQSYEKFLKQLRVKQYAPGNHIYHRIEKTEKKMNSLCRSIAFICVLFITGLAGLHIHAENTPLPDSILTRKYISQISVTEPERALALIDEMEQRKLQPQFRLDHLRSVVYQNGMSMFRLALKYSMKAYRNDSIRRHPDEALMLLELITDQYNGTGNYTESTRYALEGIELARQTGDRIAEANLLLYLGMNKRDMGLKEEADEYVEQALQMQEEMTEGCRKWKPVDDLIYIYGVKLTFAMYDGKYSEAIALLPRYEKLMEQFKNCPDIPEGMYDMRLACGYVTYARIFLADGQPEKGAEFYRKFEQTDYAQTDDGKQMRFDYLVGVKRYPEVLRFIHADKERLKEQGDTITISIWSASSILRRRHTRDWVIMMPLHRPTSRCISSRTAFAYAKSRTGCWNSPPSTKPQRRTCNCKSRLPMPIHGISGWG